MDLDHFAAYIEREADGQRQGDDRFHAFGRTVRARSLPIGIDVDEFQSLGREADAQDMFATLREQYAKRQLLVGVDRLDYSKGLPQRIRAFRRLLELYPENRRSATLIQVAAPSREDVEAYADIRQRARKPVRRASTATSASSTGCRCATSTAACARRKLPGLYRGQPRRAGHAAARRHEPGGQGVRRRAGPGRSRACWCCRASPARPSS